MLTEPFLTHFWQIKKACVLHYLSTSAFSLSKFFFYFRHWGNSERMLQMLFDFKNLTLPLAVRLEMSSKEEIFKLTEICLSVFCVCPVEVYSVQGFWYFFFLFDAENYSIPLSAFRQIIMIWQEPKMLETGNMLRNFFFIQVNDSWKPDLNLLHMCLQS